MIMRKTVNPAKLEPGMVRSWWAVLRKRKETVNAEVCIRNGQPGKLSTADDKLIKFISLQNQIMFSSPISSELAEACGTGYTYLLLERWARMRFSWKSYSQKATAMTQKQGPGTPLVKYKKIGTGVCVYMGWTDELESGASKDTQKLKYKSQESTTTMKWQYLQYSESNIFIGSEPSTGLLKLLSTYIQTACIFLNTLSNNIWTSRII